MQIFFYIIFIFSFFLTGAIQFLGISITITSYILTLFVALIMFFVFLIRKRIIINNYLIINICLIIWIVISGIVNRTSPLLVLNYFSYALIPILIYLLVKLISKNMFKTRYLINILVIFQLPVLCFQFFFPDYILYSHKPVSYLDRLFGTFPLAGDHALSFFLIMNIIFLFESKNKFSVFNYIIICSSIISILLMNSLISHFLLLFVFLYFIFKKVNYLIFIPFIVFFFSFLLYLVSSFDIMTLLGKGSVTGIIDNASLFESGTAGRFQSIYYLFTKELLFFGNGPGSYFNPFDGGFQGNVNFSQFIWFYFDLGIVGLILLCLLIFTYLSLFKINNYLKLVLAVLVFSYSFFSNTLDSIVFCLTLNIFAFLIQKNQKV